LVPLTGIVVFLGATLVGSSSVFSSLGLSEVSTMAVAVAASFLAPLRLISVSVGPAAVLTTLMMISPLSCHAWRWQTPRVTDNVFLISWMTRPSREHFTEAPLTSTLMSYQRFASMRPRLPSRVSPSSMPCWVFSQPPMFHQTRSSSSLMWNRIRKPSRPDSFRAFSVSV
jgi:hypothetical protein